MYIYPRVVEAVFIYLFIFFHHGKCKVDKLVSCLAQFLRVDVKLGRH